MNEMSNSRHYIKNLVNFVKQNKIAKNTMLIAIVPASLPINHVLHSFYASKLKNFIEIISICSKINLNNIYQNKKKYEIVDNLFTYCQSGYA